MLLNAVANVGQIFGIDVDPVVPAFGEFVPDIDPACRLNRDVTLVLLAGFRLGRRVMMKGRHGTGEYTQAE
jgi:cobaltochelatase CobS